MKKNLILFILLPFLLSVVFSCGSVRKKTESEKVKKTGNIAGIVLDGSQPVGGSEITLEEIPGRVARSDTLGRFWLSSVPVGGYALQANKLPYHGTRVSHLQIARDSTSIVICRLYPSLIPESWWCRGDWAAERKVIKTDSVSFFQRDYKKVQKIK